MTILNLASLADLSAHLDRSLGEILGELVDLAHVDAHGTAHDSTPSVSRPCTAVVEIVVGDAAALTAYRVVQEALANAARHAPGAAVTVSVRGVGGAVEVRVEDDGCLPVAVGAPAREAHGGGLGLVGMRERVTLAGGRLDAGPRENGGFGVRALLPNGRAGP